MSHSRSGKFLSNEKSIVVKIICEARTMRCACVFILYCVALIINALPVDETAENANEVKGEYTIQYPEGVLQVNYTAERKGYLIKWLYQRLKPGSENTTDDDLLVPYVGNCLLKSLCGR